MMSVSSIRIAGLLSLLVHTSLCVREEPQCSRYHYEEQLKSKIVRLEHRLELLETQATHDKNPECVQCPDMWIQFKGSCNLVEDKEYTYDDARSNCLVMDAHLVHVENKMKNEFLRRHLRTLKDAQYLIGLSDADTEGPFQWDGSSKAVSFAYWSPGQPYNSGGHENCVHFGYDSTYKWNDINCQKQFKSICEK